MYKFTLGQVVATPGAISFAAEQKINLLGFITRHVTGDDGDLDPEDKRRNKQALHDGSRIFSSYNVGQSKVWIITEADRSSTCILLPSEY